jgi:photosystem II stability/assembly factor-like uncharacterized protein
VTGPAVAIFPNDLYRVLAIPGTDTVFVGDEQGNVYRSRDGGTTWETVYNSSDATAGGIYGLVAADCNIVLFSANNSDPYFYSSNIDGSVFQSLDGGNSWEGVEVPTNAGILDVFACDVNRYWLVGVDGLLARLSGPTITM